MNIEIKFMGALGITILFIWMFEKLALSRLVSGLLGGAFLISSICIVHSLQPWRDPTGLPTFLQGITLGIGVGLISSALYSKYRSNAT